MTAQKLDGKGYLSLIGLIVLGGIIFGGCHALLFKQTEGEQARDECVKSFIAKNQLTKEASQHCNALGQEIDSRQ